MGEIKRRGVYFLPRRRGGGGCEGRERDDEAICPVVKGRFAPERKKERGRRRNCGGRGGGGGNH